MRRIFVLVVLMVSACGGRALDDASTSTGAGAGSASEATTDGAAGDTSESEILTALDSAWTLLGAL